LTDYTIVDKFESSIATMTPTARQRRLTVVLAAIVLIATTIIAPFGAVQLPRIDGFIPATQSVIIITDLLTAVLLFSQSRVIGSRGVLLLASGYLFSALIVLCICAFWSSWCRTFNHSMAIYLLAFGVTRFSDWLCLFH
jgi:hypothetical protein